jgi:glycosyltransferase involved in cell wall biosynthesis
MKKNICIIASEFPPDVGGIGNHAFNLAKSLSNSLYKVTVVADVSHINEETIDSFKQSNEFRFFPVVRKKIALIIYLERIIKTVKHTTDNDIVICSGKFSLWLINVIRVFHRKKKAIAVVHGSELLLHSRLSRKLVNISLARFNAIIAVSSYTKRFINKKIMNKIATYVIPNGIDYKELIPYQRIQQPKGSLQLITIGSVTERKGQENVIRALPQLLQLYPNVTYHIIGKPVIKGRLLQLCKALNVERHVVFHGAVVRTALLNIISDATIKLMLSNHTKRGDFEGFGIAILEANAIGKPAIGSNFSGITDTIADKQTGRLVNPHNEASIVEALQDILHNYSFYAKNAVAWAQQHDWQNIITKYISVIEKI